MTGNLITLADNGVFDVIVHGCNCFENMGAGIAYAIRQRWPEAFSADCSYSFSGDYDKLGNFSEAVVNSGNLRIINAYTQFGYNGRRSNVAFGDVFDYTSFDLILQKLYHHYPNKHFGFPLIGCGLAGGNRERIIGSLNKFSELVEKSNGSVTLVTL